MTIQQNLDAVETLKRLGIVFSYGFMLFDPSTTFETIRDNVDFLREIVGDGSAPALFSRMLPYGGTPIRERLAKEGRLRGDLTRPDYDFLDLRINEYHRLLTHTVRPWIHKQGLAYQLSYAWDELETIARLVPAAQDTNAYRAALRTLTAESNERLFRLIEESSLAFEQGERSLLEPESIRAYCARTQERLIELRDDYVAANLDPLGQVINADCSSGPILMPQIH
jgi:hypothetical protein